MASIMVVGAGKIGSLIACLLANSEQYQVHLADLDFKGADVLRLLKSMPDIQTVALDIKDREHTVDYLKKHKIISDIS